MVDNLIPVYHRSCGGAAGWFIGPDECKEINCDTFQFTDGSRPRFESCLRFRCPECQKMINGPQCLQKGESL